MLGLATILAVIVCPSVSAQTRDSDIRQIDISSTELTAAIAELSREQYVSIGGPAGLPRSRTVAVRGQMTIEQALARILAGSGYVAHHVGGTAWRIEKARRQTRPVAPAKQPKPLPNANQAVPAAEDNRPIIVTAQKRSGQLDSLPLAISVVAFGTDRPGDVGSDTDTIAASIEGMSVTGLGSGRNRMFLRGIADSSFNGESQATVAVLLDDARLTYSAPDPNLRLIDMERVEVIKGPQGSLYGNGALGGIYHMVSRRADPDRTQLTMSGGVEGVGHGSLGYSVSAVGNLPISEGTAAIRLVGYTAVEPGWIDTGDRHNSNQSQVAGLRAGLGIEAGGGWRLDATGLAQWQNSDDSQYVYAPRSRARPAQNPEPHDNDLRHVALRLARSAGGNINIVLSSGMTWHEVGDTFDATLGADSFGLADPLLLLDKREYRLSDNELRLNGTSASFDWLGGVSYVRAQQSIIETLVSASPDASLVVDDDRRVTHDLALFGDVTYRFGSAFSIEGGARLFHSTVKETRVFQSGPISQRRHDVGITPSIALSWKPYAGRLVFLRYGAANRQGGSDIVRAGEVDLLNSDELAIVEAGWREDLARGGRLDLGIYFGNWENLQSDLLQSDGLLETRNAGTARIVGGEVTLTQPLASGWKLSGGATVTMAKLVSNTLGIELTDRHLPVVPTFSLRSAFGRDFTMGNIAASLNLTMRYLGASRLSFDPVIDRPMGDLLETGLEGQFRFDKFILRLSAENILGRKDDGFPFGNPLRFASTRQYTPQRPPSVSVTLTVPLH